MRIVPLVVVIAACNASPAVAPLDIAWTPCELETATREPAECAIVHVPYTWDDPGGRTIDLSVKRYATGTGTSRGQLWFLEGGPGGSVRPFDAAAEYFAQRGLDLDYYLLDQRGTGQSTRLGCPEQEAAATPGGFSITADEWPACLAAMQAAYEPTLAGFTVTNTAHDLGALIDATRTRGAPVIIYGVSYAPYMINRYLQLYPEQPTGVVLDSICGVGNCTFSQADVKFDDVAHAYLDACGADPFCAAQLGPDPWSTLGAVYDALEAGQCPAATAAGLTRSNLRHAFAQLLYDWSERTLVPAITRRLERCGAQDVPVLQHFAELVTAPATEAGLDDFSTAMAFHIGLSELWDEPSPSPAELAAAEAGELIENSTGPQLAAVHDIWPRTPHDEYFGAWATTDVPILMLGGSLDPATPLAFEQGAMAAFHAAHQTFVSVPRASHGVMAEAPTTDGRSCGVELVLAFAANPIADVDQSCVAAVAPLDFHASSASSAFLGTSDLWGD